MKRSGFRTTVPIQSNGAFRILNGEVRSDEREAPLEWTGSSEFRTTLSEIQTTPFMQSNGAIQSSNGG